MSGVNVGGIPNTYPLGLPSIPNQLAIGKSSSSNAPAANSSENSSSNKRASAATQEDEPDDKKGGKRVTRDFFGINLCRDEEELATPTRRTCTATCVVLPKLLNGEEDQPVITLYVTLAVFTTPSL